MALLGRAHVTSRGLGCKRVVRKSVEHFMGYDGIRV